MVHLRLSYMHSDNGWIFLTCRNRRLWFIPGITSSCVVPTDINTEDMSVQHDRETSSSAAWLTTTCTNAAWYEPRIQSTPAPFQCAGKIWKVWLDYIYLIFLRLMVSVNVKGSWVCYAWDLRDHYVNIIDPSAGRADDDFIKMVHSNTIKLLEHSIVYTISNMFRS